MLNMTAVTANNINLVQLEEALEVDSENLEQLQFWYEQLSELELDGSETSETVELLFRALKWLMQYEHTNAEELKEIAEKEAVEMAEKEENWEQEKEILKEELSLLRERITSKAGTDDMNEAFRAEIDSLKAEINHLKQTGRDRDRELADQQDKNEELTAKVEAFEKERTLLVQNQSQLEDTIRELNRRITSKSDSSDKDWEARKLKQRSEQAFILSNQLQNAVTQNEHLQTEVERLSSTLESATVLIKDTTEKYGTLKEQLSNSEKTIEKLLDDNQNLKKQLALRQSDLVEKIENFEVSAKEVEDLIKSKDNQIEKYKELLNDQLMEIDEQRARLALVKNDEREAELERLRQELVEATKLARQLFGSMSGDIAVGQSLDPTAELRVRIVQLDKQLEIAQHKIADLKEENKKLEKIAEEKDVINAKINGELERIRKISFGDADEEIKHLERQIRYREEQIEELTTKCSLLQIELQKYEDSPAKMPSEETKHVPSTKPKPTTVPKTPPRRGPIIKKPVQRPTITPKPQIVETEHEEDEMESEKSPPRREISETYLNDVEASAMIISSLNYELMRVLQENEDKERQLKEYEKQTKDHTKDLQLARAKITELISKYAELKAQSMISLDLGGSNDEQVAKDARLQELEIKVIELERLADSIKQSGTEVDRRMEEAARKLIYVQIKNAEFERQIDNSERIQKSAVEMTDRMRAKLRRCLTGENRKLKTLSRDYELSMIEIARLQNVIIHSVPLTQYEKVLKAYKSVMHKSTLNVEYNVEHDLGFEADPIPNISANFGISNDQSSTIIENLSLKNLEIQEINEILESQNEFFRRENERQQLEINELKAFLTDIENQTELKSLIVNIERRFLQGIQEAADSSDEQYFSEKELRTITKKLTLRKKAWKQERQNLVGIIVGLQNTVQRLKQQTTSVIRMDHLIQIKESAEKLKDRERDLNEKEELVDKKLSDISIRESFVESQAGAIKTVMDADYNLQRIQKSIQGYEFNVLALSNELKTAKNEIENLKKQLDKNEIELEELKRENNDLISMKMDFSQIEQQEEDESKSEDEESEEKRRQKERRKKKPRRENSLINQLPRQLSNAYQTAPSESEEEDSTLSTEPSSSSERSERKEKTRTVIYDNSGEYQKQMEQVKERARLCIQSYKDQLDQKDSAIEEYRQLLESLRRQLLEKSIKEIETEPLAADERPKTSAELLNNVILEEKEREIFALEKEIRKLEDINGELSERLSATTTTSLSSEKKNIGCQTDRTNDTMVSNNNNNSSTKNPNREESFDADFESDSDDSGSDREDARTPVPPSSQQPQPEANNPSGGPPGANENSSESDSNSEEEESEGGTTDSGTVEDIEVRPRKPSRSSSRSSSADNRRRSSETITVAKPTPSPAATKPPPKRPTSTSTITKPPPLVVAGDDREQVIYGQRNEIRKLRERIGALERKARQLEAERDSWKERNRFGGKREQDPDAESSMLRKENERLRRESKNLTRTLENQKHKIDELEKALTRRASTLQNKESVENWEEKKRFERNLANLKKRLEESETRENELIERLERREKHIEQISREQGGRNYDSDRLQQIVRVLKSEKEGFDQRETNLKQEIEVWKDRGRETMGRLDQALKENRLLKARLERLSQKVEELQAVHQIPQHPHVPFPSPPKQPQQPQLQHQQISPPKQQQSTVIPKHSIHTQTTPRSSPSPRDTVRYVTVPPQPSIPLPTSSKEPIREPTNYSSSDDKAEIQKLRKQTRLFELRVTELQEEIEESQKRYDNLRESYTKVVRVDRERLKDTEKIAAISVLRDKLVAKDKEIDYQRRRINDLERKVFHFENH